MLNTNIFKTYDVRGIYPQEINEETVYLISRAFVKWLKSISPAENFTIAVGYDMRLSSEALFKSVLNGLNQENAKILSVGFAPTPLVGFTVAQQKCDAGIVISASHNPSEYNALKLLKKEVGGIMQIGKTQGLIGIQKITAKLDTCNGTPVDITQFAEHTEEFKKNYIKYIASKFKLQKAIKIVCDYGNGMGGVLMPKILEIFKNVNATHLFSKPDGSFPNHEPNPHNKENFNILKEKVKKNNADIGLFFDGDCDRVFFVDENGEIIGADLIIALLAEYELEKNPTEKKVYYDLRASRILKEILEKKGAEAIKMPTGNPLIKEKLIFNGGLLGGEISGHIMFKDHFCLDDGFYAAFKVLEIIDKKNKLLSELIKPYQKYFKIHEINIPLKENPEKILKILAQKFKSLYPQAKFEYLDGITIEFPDWWGNIRASNTENLLRLNIEASSEELLHKTSNEMLSIIKAV